MSITIPVSRVAPALKRATEGHVDKLDSVLLFTGLALLVWILSRIDRSQMITALTEVSIPVFFLIFILVFINLGSQFSRWKYLIESNSNHYDVRDLLPSFFAGFAFRLMIPGGHAEITKIFLMPGKKNGKIFFTLSLFGKIRLLSSSIFP